MSKNINIVASYKLFTDNALYDDLSAYLKRISTKECFIIEDKTIKCKTLKSTIALFKAYAKQNCLCIRFDKMQCNFAKQYLKKYITEDKSDSKTDAFIRCKVSYNDFEAFFDIVKKSVIIDNAKQTEAEKKKAEAEKQTVTKQTEAEAK